MREHVAFVSMVCANSSSVWAAGIRNVFIKYGLFVSSNDLWIGLISHQQLYHTIICTHR